MVSSRASLLSTPRNGEFWDVLREYVEHDLVLSRRVPYDEQARAEGRDWPVDAETMVGLRRLDNIQQCITTVVQDGVPGDLIETGVWRGGATIFMRGVLAALDVTDRTVWVADSFEGLPPPDVGSYQADAGDRHWTRTELAVSLEEVKANFRRYGLLDEQIRFVPGWFRDTLSALLPCCRRRLPRHSWRGRTRRDGGLDRRSLATGRMMVPISTPAAGMANRTGSASA